MTVRSRNTDSAAEPARVDLVRLLRESYSGPAWHGPSLRSVLRRVTPPEALWRPAPGRNTVWELLLHVAYGRHTVLGRLARYVPEPYAPERPPSFPYRLRRAWWPAMPEAAMSPGPLAVTAWNNDIALLAEQHERLTAAVQAIPARYLAAQRPGAHHTLAQEVAGIALHDTYHSGQIRLIRLLHAGQLSPPRRS